MLALLQMVWYLKIIDGVEDNKTPGKIDYKITKDNIGGNCVFVDIGNGLVAFYGHLQRNSIKVKKGDRIFKGQFIVYWETLARPQRRICTFISWIAIIFLLMNQ